MLLLLVVTKVFIGQALAIALAEAGADIIGVSYSGKFDETEKMIESTGRKFTSYVSDFSNRESLHDFIKTVTCDFAKIDILLNNAGTILRDPIAELKIRVSFDALVLCDKNIKIKHKNINIFIIIFNISQLNNDEI